MRASRLPGSGSAAVRSSLPALIRAVRLGARYARISRCSSWLGLDPVADGQGGEHDRQVSVDRFGNLNDNGLCSSGAVRMSLSCRPIRRRGLFGETICDPTLHSLSNFGMRSRWPAPGICRYSSRPPSARRDLQNRPSAPLKERQVHASMSRRGLASAHPGISPNQRGALWGRHDLAMAHPWSKAPHAAK